jgi:hypothetical protein
VPHDQVPSEGFSVSEPDLDRILSEVVEQVAMPFPSDSCLHNLDVRLTRMPTYPAARYSPARPPRTRATAFFDPAAYHAIADVTLDVVHECVPGHHWQYSAYERGHRGHGPCWYYENDMFVEGWARYCEVWYATQVDEPRIREASRHRLTKYATQALAVLLVHGAGEAPGRVVRLLVGEGRWRAGRAAALVAGAYLNPWRAVGPMLGYLALRQVSTLEGEERLRELVRTNGMVDLSRVVVGRG